MCSQIINNKPAQRVLFLISLVWPASPYALETLSDQEMGKVSGQDGVTISLQVPENQTITAEQIRWELDTGEADAGSNSLANQIIIGSGGTEEDNSQFTLQAIGANGATATEALDFALAIDAFTNSANRPGLALDATWNRMRMQMDDLTVTDTGRSFGTMALDSAGRFAIVGDGGLFNHDNNQARLILNLGNVVASDPNPSNWTINDPGDLFFRMTEGGTEAILHNFGFLFDMHEGIVGIDEDGFVLQSAGRTDFNLTFDLYANATGQDFQFAPYVDANTSIPMLLFGWRGGLENLDLRMRPEGTWLDSGVHTQGLTTSLKFDLASDFQFVIGEAGDDRSFLEFANPVSLTAANGTALNRNDVEFGYLTLDTVSAGHDTVPNICYGGGNPYGGVDSACSSSTEDILPVQSIDLPASDTGLALVARDWGLHAYASKVQYRDGVTSDNDVNDGWALIYTLGDISSNWYLYPQAGGGTDAETDAGFIMDVATAIQTVGGADPVTGRPLRQRWEDGTNLMIGDTDFTYPSGHPAADYAQGMAIGLMGSDLLFVADDMGVALTQLEGLGLSSDAVRLQLRGIFGGGDIPRMTHPVYGSYIDMNLEFDKFQFNLFPALFDGSYINFGGFFSLANLNNGFAGNTTGGDSDDGSYISLAEPNFNKLDVDVRLADITGDIRIPLSVVGDGGKIDLISASGTQGQPGFEGPKLKIETNMKVGAAAMGDGSGDPLTIGRIEFGNKDLGSMIVPSANIYTSVTLEQQNTP